MSKLNLSNSLLYFLQKNKSQLIAISLMATMSCSITSCKSNIQNNIKDSSISITHNKSNDLKNRIENNINVIDVIKNDSINGYYIYEQLYNKENFIGYDQYFISFEDAKNLELTELLDSKILYKAKTK